VVRVAPDHAACYWQAMSEVLARLGAQDAHVEISVLEPTRKPVEETTQALVELEMRSADLAQSMLDDAVRQTRPLCGTTGHRAAPWTDAEGPLHESADGNMSTLVAPLSARADVTVRAPLTPGLKATIHAPLLPTTQLGASAPIVVAPPAQARPQPVARSAFRRRVVELFNIGVTLIAIFIGLRLLIQTFSVDGPSMLPTFETGQRLLVNRAAYWHVDGTPFDGLVPFSKQGTVTYVFGGPHRGDVVVFRPPGESNFQSDLIKRIIGVPGDTVSIQAGQVYVNGEHLVEPYVQFLADYTYPAPDLAVLVPSDSYFVLGDNRPVSADSHLGWLVSADKFVGEAWLSYWPIEHWGIIPRRQPSAVN
jgi:signal peptidase I